MSDKAIKPTRQGLLTLLPTLLKIPLQKNILQFVPSPNPLAKISNRFTPLQYHNSPFEDQYLKKDELLLVIVLEKVQAKTGTNPCFNKNPSPDHFYLNIRLIMIIWTRDPFLVYLVQTWDFIKVSKMFIDFGPVPIIFPIEINEAYNYFSEKLSSNILCSFTSYNLDTSLGIYYQYETVDIKILCCQTKVKIDEWFIAKLASATSVEEFEATLLKARSIPNSDNLDQSNAESSQSNSYLRNEDMFD
ncbi:hypothetical protein CR513_30297, partial [Mucuna pruriens]